MQKRRIQWPLYRRIVLQMLAIYAGCLSLAALGFVVYLWSLDVITGFQSNDDSFSVIREATSIDETGRLDVKETSRLSELRSSTPHLWYVVRAGQQVLTYGAVPENFTSLLLGNPVRRADITGRSAYDTPNMSLRTDVIEGSDVTFIIGGSQYIEGISFYTKLATWTLGYNLPIFIALSIGTCALVPLLVRRSLKGLEDATKQAESIDIDKPGTRLPADGIPSHLQPLIQSFNRALERIDEGYERQQRFMAQAAHELRTPIAILQTRLESAPPNDVQNRALQDLARLNALAGQLLDLQRLGKAVGKDDVLDLVSLSQEVVGDFAPLAISSGYDLSFDSDARTVVIRGDRTSIQRALSNLVSNAICHADSNGQIAVTVSRSGLVTVEDDGVGIPEEELERVLQPFHRLGTSKPGSGLGLSLVQEIVALHQGSVRISRIVPRGTRVVLDFSTLVHAVPRQPRFDK